MLRTVTCEIISKRNAKRGPYLSLPQIVATETRLRDIVADIPPAVLGKEVTRRGRELRNISASAMAQTARTELRIALQGLVDRAGLELERLGMAPYDAEIGARAVRNCLEVNLIGRYLIDSTDNVRNWFSLRAQDEIDILSAQLKIFGHDSSPADLEIIKSRVLELQALVAKYDMPKATGLPRWSQLAERFGLKDDYDALYGLFSKYIHPSAWLTVNPDEGWAETFAHIFVVHAQVYSIDLVVRSLDALGLSDASIREALSTQSER